MYDRDDREYQTVRVAGDLAQLGNVTVDGWRLHMIVERQKDNVFICLLERVKSRIIT